MQVGHSVCVKTSTRQNLIYDGRLSCITHKCSFRYTSGNLPLLTSFKVKRHTGCMGCAQFGVFWFKSLVKRDGLVRISLIAQTNPIRWFKPISYLCVLIIKPAKNVLLSRRSRLHTQYFFCFDIPKI